MQLFHGRHNCFYSLCNSHLKFTRSISGAGCLGSGKTVLVSNILIKAKYIFQCTRNISGNTRHFVTFVTTVSIALIWTRIAYLWIQLHFKCIAQIASACYLCCVQIVFPLLMFLVLMLLLLTSNFCIGGAKYWQHVLRHNYRCGSFTMLHIIESLLQTYRCAQVG